MRYRFAWDRVRAEDRAIPRRRFIYTLQVSPSRSIAQIVLDGDYGEQVDFANSRRAFGGTTALSTTIRPTDHLELASTLNRRWIDVKPEGGEEGRLFTADIERLRATYTFTARAYLRLIGQNVRTRFHPQRYAFRGVPNQIGATTASALFAYKLNWQSVLFVGYGDERDVLDNRDPPNDPEKLEPASRTFFLKLSYAFQH